MSIEVALALPILPAVAEPVAEPIQLSQDELGSVTLFLDSLEQRGLAVAHISPEQVVTISRSLLFFPIDDAAIIVRKCLKGTRQSHYLTPPEKERIIALWQQGLTIYTIANLLRRDRMAVSSVIHQSFPEANLAPSQPDYERGKKIVKAFWEEWAKQPLPLGVINRLARRFDVVPKTVELDLKRAGVDVSGEILKKRLLFILEVERTMKEPFHPTKSRLRVSQKTLSTYRVLVWQGVHLKWATELAETSKVDWDCEIVLTGETLPRKFNVGLRNRTVLGELARLDSEITKKRRLKLMVRSAERLESLTVEINELQTAREKYLAAERQFRQQYHLPSMDVLEAEQ